MLLGDPRQADLQKQSFNFSMAIHQSLDPAAQEPSSMSSHACVNESSTYPLSGTSVDERTRAIDNM